MKTQQERKQVSPSVHSQDCEFLTRPELTNSLFLLELVTKKSFKFTEEMDRRKTVLRAQKSSLLYLATTLGLGVDSELLLQDQ